MRGVPKWILNGGSSFQKTCGGRSEDKGELGDYIDLAESGRGARQLQRLRSKHAGESRICQIRDVTGSLQSGDADVAEVFAAFYENLYKSEEDAGFPIECEEVPFEIEPVTFAELEKALRQLKNKRTGGDDGLVAEMLKTGHADLLTAIAAHFTDVLYG